MVEFGNIELIHRDLLDVCVGLVNAPSQRGWIHWSYQPEFSTDADGDFVFSQPTTNASASESDDLNDDTSAAGPSLHRCVSELWTSDWWRDTEASIPGYNTPDLPTRILAIGIATDETAITLTGNVFVAIT